MDKTEAFMAVLDDIAAVNYGGQRADEDEFVARDIEALRRFACGEGPGPRIMNGGRVFWALAAVEEAIEAAIEGTDPVGVDTWLLIARRRAS